MIPYKESQKHKPLECYTNEELKEHHYDPEEIKAHTSNAESKGMMREKNMTTIKEAAQQYTPQHTKNIADLPEVNIEQINLEDRQGTDNKGETFNYKVIVVDGEEYRVPGSVIGSIKGILQKKADLKRVSVSKTGEGMNTRYTVIPIE